MQLLKTVFQISISIVLLAAFAACSSTTATRPAKHHVYHPQTPSLDSLRSICELPYDKLTRIPRSKEDGSSDYFLNGKPFSGWACSNDSSTPHQYRFMHVINGKLFRQIGYFSNGQVDHDFAQMDGESIGSERMWIMNGNLYVSNYYILPGIKHDTQKLFSPNGQIIKMSFYDSGLLVWQKDGILQVMRLVHPESSKNSINISFRENGSSITIKKGLI